MAVNWYLHDMSVVAYTLTVMKGTMFISVNFCLNNMSSAFYYVILNCL